MSDPSFHGSFGGWSQRHFADYPGGEPDAPRWSRSARLGAILVLGFLTWTLLVGLADALVSLYQS